MSITPKLLQLDGLKTQLRERLPEYLRMFRPELRPGKNFGCINPAHPDRTPSMGIVPANRELCHCFTCDTTADIFTACHMLESKPITGPGFVHDNMFHLARIFGLEVPALELSEQELHDMQTYRAYGAAAEILLSSGASESVLARLNMYDWSLETQQQMGVGCVESYDDYLRRMQEYGFELPFLRLVDLDNRKIFHPDNLIFIVRDEHGSCVGFAARDTQFEAKKQAVLAGLVEGTPEYQAAKKQLPPKFYNSVASVNAHGQLEPRNHIYDKASRLYGLHVARRHTPPLYIFEGYGDAVTLHHYGLKNSVAVGATAFTANHLEMLLKLGINHLIFVFDGDSAGWAATDRAIQKVEAVVANHVGLKAQIVIVPEGKDDPDRMVRNEGLDAFLSLEKIDLFAYKLRRAIQLGTDADQVFEETLGLILNEQHHLKRFRMAQQLASATGIAEDIVWKEIDRRSDIDQQRIKSEMLLVADQTQQQLRKRPEELVQIMHDVQARVERISVQKNAYDTNSLLDYFDAVTEEAESDNDEHGLLTGYPIFDARFGGIPKKDAFITMPGKPNHGKSTFLCNVAGRLVERYDNVIVLVHTIDDPLSKFWGRLLGARFGIPSYYFEKAGYHLENRSKVWFDDGTWGEFGDIYHECKRWMRNAMLQERLLPFDVSQMPSRMDVLEWKVAEVRKKYPSSYVVVIGDNFHQYDLPGDGLESDQRQISKQVKQLCTKYHATALMTVEIPKDKLQAGLRPRGSAIKGSGGIFYDASANVGIYNDLKDMRDKAVLKWERRLPEPENVAGERITSMMEPVIEMVFDKSKLYKGFDGEIYYRLTGTTGGMEECSTDEQHTWRRAVRDAEEEREERRRNKQNGRGGAGYHSYQQPRQTNGVAETPPWEQ